MAGGQPKLSRADRAGIRRRMRQLQDHLAARSSRAFATIFDVSGKTAASWLGGADATGEVPSTAHLVAFANKRGVNPAWLLLGKRGGAPFLDSGEPIRAELAEALHEAMVKAGAAALEAQGMEPGEARRKAERLMPTGEQSLATNLRLAEERCQALVALEALAGREFPQGMADELMSTTGAAQPVAMAHALHPSPPAPLYQTPVPPPPPVDTL